MNTSHTPVPAARQRAYSGQARSYDRDTGAFHPYRRQLVEALPLDRGQVVLDVGCGTGLCCGLLRDKVGPRGGVVGIEESPQMAAVACERIALEGWRNVSVVQSPAEDARITPAADAALFCAVHDILQSPGALRNVLARLRPGAWVAAGGGKWATPALIGMNLLISMLHAPYVGSFSGFSRPWRHLEQLVEDVQVREMGFGSGYIMTGRVPGPARPVPVTRTQGRQVPRPAGHRRPDPRARPPARPASRAPWPAPQPAAAGKQAIHRGACRCLSARGHGPGSGPASGQIRSPEPKLNRAAVPVWGQAGDRSGRWLPWPDPPVGRLKIGPFWLLVPEFCQHPDQAGGDPARHW